MKNGKVRTILRRLIPHADPDADRATQREIRAAEEIQQERHAAEARLEALDDRVRVLRRL